MTAQSPDPFPTDGLRELSPREAMQRVAALACTLPKDSEPACTGQVNVGTRTTHSPAPRRIGRNNSLNEMAIMRFRSIFDRN